MHDARPHAVGVLMFHGTKLLLVEQPDAPGSFAAPSRDLDHDEAPAVVASRLVEGKLGLTVETLELRLARLMDQDSTEAATTTYWRVYRATTSGALRSGAEKTERARWFAPGELDAMAELTRRRLLTLRGAAARPSAEECAGAPQLSPLWLYLLSEMELIAPAEC